MKSLLERRDLNDLEIHVNEVRKRGTKIETRLNSFNFEDFDYSSRNYILALKNSEKNDLEDMVSRMIFRCSEIDIFSDKTIFLFD